MNGDIFLRIRTYKPRVAIRHKIHGLYGLIRYDCNETTDLGGVSIKH